MFALHTLQLNTNFDTTPTTTPNTKQWNGRRARQRLRIDSTPQSLKMDTATVISLFSPGVKGAYVNKNGNCFSGKWQNVGTRTGKDIVKHMVDAIHCVVKVFCPKDPMGFVQSVILKHSDTTRSDGET